jgi:phosphocarrier protein
MIQQKIKLSRKALHPRFITQLVQEASRFNSDIFLTHNGNKVNAKSIMGILSLAIPTQAEITLEASGQDETEAIDQVIKKLESLS